MGNIDRIEELRRMPYPEYLQTPEWIGKRDMALDRAEYHCQICNAPHALNVHHRTYENRGNERLQDLTVLCNSCHELYHHKDLIGNHIVSIETSVALMQKDIKNPEYMKIGFIEIDNLLNGGLRKGELIIVAGVPRSGKSIFSTNILLHAAHHNNINCLVYSLEMNHSQFSSRLLSLLSRIPLDNIKLGRISSDDMEWLENASNLLKNMAIHIDDTPSLTVQQIKYRATQFKNTHELDFILIDSFQLIENDASVTSYNSHYTISEKLKTLKTLAKTTNSVVIVNTCLNSNLEKRVDKRPQLQDFEGDAFVANADIIFFLYRPEIYCIEGTKGLAEINIAKNRNGSEGCVILAFIQEYLRFENLEKV